MAFTAPGISNRNQQSINQNKDGKQFSSIQGETYSLRDIHQWRHHDLRHRNGQDHRKRRFRFPSSQKNEEVRRTIHGAERNRQQERIYTARQVGKSNQWRKAQRYVDARIHRPEVCLMAVHGVRDHPVSGDP